MLTDPRQVQELGHVPKPRSQGGSAPEQLFDRTWEVWMSPNSQINSRKARKFLPQFRSHLCKQSYSKFRTEQTNIRRDTKTDDSSKSSKKCLNIGLITPLFLQEVEIATLFSICRDRGMQCDKQKAKKISSLNSGPALKFAPIVPGVWGILRL